MGCLCIMQNKEDTWVYAGFFVRLGAFIVDSVIVSFFLLIFRIPMNYVNLIVGETIFTKSIIFQYSIWDITLYVLGVMYYVLLTYITGNTLGKKLFRLQVISSETGGRPEFFDILYRETIGRFFCTASLNFGYLLAGIDKEKRGIHDIVSDTRVIYRLKTIEKIVILKTIEENEHLNGNM